ncbi:MAG: ribonucleoside-diphosphate reductase alpha chain [Bacteroidetes bacterium]|nr:MAG: ribonucleoside-diphosphate reductase alpha chain [Bacteroidota bacterium]
MIVEEPNLHANALRVLQSRYLLREQDNRAAETPGGLFRRVAQAVAQAELQYGGDAESCADIFFTLMNDLLFLPNSPTLMNAGMERQQLSACFVLPVDDSIDSIFTTLRQAALIHQSGGGTGLNFSKIRPAGDPLGPEPGRATGPLSFIKIFDAATDKIRQGGKRRGANMGILDITHPDIAAFITAKKEPGTITNFNLSVGITDAFMRAVEANTSWSLLHPASGNVAQEIPARELWNLLAEMAWESGDPGIVFLDRIEEANPVPAAGRINCTNPCGEVPLLPFEACNLGSVNLAKMILRENDRWKIDWNKLETTVKTAIRFLDDVIDVNAYILPQTETVVKANRKIGLGVMGWADLLMRLRIPYASDEAVALGKKLMQFIREKSHEASAALAAERGVFPNWPESKYYPGTRMRNATCTAIAPTGTISVIAGASSSIEPVFALAFRREHALGGADLEEINPVFAETLGEMGIAYEDISTHVMQEGTLAGTALPPEIKQVFLTAYEIDPSRHLLHQSVFQQFTDNAVSKTINLPAKTTVAETGAIFMQAWKLGLKGITVFREGSRGQVVLRPGISCKVCST